jgi:hypothetical protein
MNTLANLQALTQTSFDSGSLGGLGVIVHRMDQAGDHQIKVFQAERLLQTYSLRVVGPAAPNAGQVNIDLSRALGRLNQLSPRPPEDLLVAVSGYAVFHAPPGVSGLAVQLQAPGAKGQSPVFDNRQLKDGDIFAVTIFRPGRYSLTNTIGGAKGELRVSYPVVGDTPYVPPDPLQAQVTAQGFQPGSLQLQPAQGIVFTVSNTAARIQIDLVEPDDGPAKPGGPARPVTRGPSRNWQKPGPPQGRVT